MADPFYQLPSDTSNTGKFVDNSQVNDGTNNLLRQNIVIADPSVTASLANVIAADAGFNGLTTVGAVKTATFTTSGSGAQDLGPIDCRGFNTITIATTVNSTVGLTQAGRISSTSGGSYNTCFTFIDASTAGSTPAALGSTAGHTYVSEVFDNFFQMHITALTSGTWSGTITLSNRIMAYPTVAATQSGNFTFGIQSVNATGTITTSSSSIVTSSTSVNSGFALISMHGTHAGISFGITVSDDTGTDYYNVPIYDATANQWLAPGSTITPGSNASKTYYVPVFPNACAVKVLASAYTSGTGNIKISLGQGITPGSTMSQIMDAAGNNRGVNVNSNNQLSTTVDNVGQGLLGGATVYRISALTTVQTVKGSAGKLIAGWALNLNSTLAWINCFNTTGTVTLGSTVPDFSIPLQINSTAANGASDRWSIPGGWQFTNGLKIAGCTTDGGATTVTTGLGGAFFYN